MEAEVYKAGDKFSPASLVKLTFHCPASATGEVQKSTHCMKVPVKPEEGSQNVSVCSAAHISTQGCSSRPFQRCHFPVWRPACTCQPYEGRRGAEHSCAHVPIVTGLCHVPVSNSQHSLYSQCLPCLHHQTPSQSFAHPSSGFHHVLMLQVTWKTLEQLQTLSAPLKREQQLC